MSGGIAGGRLKEERKMWRRDHPYGFYARPTSKGDGSTDIMTWEAGIPGKKLFRCNFFVVYVFQTQNFTFNFAKTCLHFLGKEGTDWEGGVYKVRQIRFFVVSEKELR